MLSPSTNIEQIIDRLIEEGSSGVKLAKELGVTTATISRWHRGKTPNNIIALRKLAVIAKVSLDELLGGPNDRTPRPEPDIVRLINRFEAMMRNVRQGKKLKILHSNSNVLSLVEKYLDNLEKILDAIRKARRSGCVDSSRR